MAGGHREGAVEALRNALGISGVLKNCLTVLDMAGVVLVGVSFAVFIASSFAVRTIRMTRRVVQCEVVFYVGAVG